MSNKVVKKIMVYILFFIFYFLMKELLSNFAYSVHFLIPVVLKIIPFFVFGIVLLYCTDLKGTADESSRTMLIINGIIFLSISVLPLLYFYLPPSYFVQLISHASEVSILGNIGLGVVCYQCFRRKKL